jgi:hypothetical protein
MRLVNEEALVDLLWSSMKLFIELIRTLFYRTVITGHCMSSIIFVCQFLTFYSFLTNHWIKLKLDKGKKQGSKIYNQRPDSNQRPLLKLASTDVIISNRGPI